MEDIKNLESDLMISIYENQRFIVEQDTQIFSYLKYDFVLEGAADKVKNAIKNIIDKIVSYIQKLIGYLKMRKAKISAKNFDDIKKAYKLIMSNKKFFEDIFMNDINMYSILYYDEFVEYIENNKLSNLESSIVSEINNIIDKCKNVLDYVKNNKLNSSTYGNEEVNDFLSRNSDIKRYIELSELWNDNAFTDNKVRDYLVSLGYPKFIFSYTSTDNRENRDIHSLLNNYKSKINSKINNISKNEITKMVNNYFNSNTYTNIVANYDTDGSKLKDLDKKLEIIYSESKNIDGNIAYFGHIIHKLWNLAFKLILVFSPICMEIGYIVDDGQDLNKKVILSYNTLKSLYNLDKE